MDPPAQRLDLASLGGVGHEHLISEGGYETRGLSSGDGWFAPTAEDAVVATVRDLAKKVGRP